MARQNASTFLGPQLGLSIAGNHAYAYSGIIAIADTATDLINTISGKYILKMKWDSAYSPDAYSTDRYAFKLYLNGQVILTEFHYDNNIENGPHKEIIIPPNTTIKITAENVLNSTSNNCITALTGKVYDI